MKKYLILIIALVGVSYGQWDNSVFMDDSTIYFVTPSQLWDSTSVLRGLIITAGKWTTADTAFMRGEISDTSDVLRALISANLPLTSFIDSLQNGGNRTITGTWTFNTPLADASVANDITAINYLLLTSFGDSLDANLGNLTNKLQVEVEDSNTVGSGYYVTPYWLENNYGNLTNKLQVEVEDSTGYAAGNYMTWKRFIDNLIVSNVTGLQDSLNKFMEYSDSNVYFITPDSLNNFIGTSNITTIGTISSGTVPAANVSSVGDTVHAIVSDSLFFTKDGLILVPKENYSIQTLNLLSADTMTTNELQVTGIDSGYVPFAIDGNGTFGESPLFVNPTNVKVGTTLDIYGSAFIRGISKWYSGSTIMGELSYGSPLAGNGFGITSGFGYPFSLSSNGGWYNNLVISTDGKIGIQRVSPLADFHVEGDVLITTGSGGSLTDSSWYFTGTSGMPELKGYGTDGDLFLLVTGNTSKEALFKEADTFNFDDDVTIDSSLTVSGIATFYDNIGTTIGSYNYNFGSGNFNASTSYTYSTAYGYQNAYSATGAIIYNQLTGNQNAYSASGVSYNQLTGEQNAYSAAVNVTNNQLTGYQNAYSATGTVSYNQLVGERNAYSATGTVTYNQLIGYRNAYLSAGVSYSQLSGYKNADSVLTNVRYTIASGADNFGGTLTDASLNYAIGMPYRTFYRSTAADLDYAIGIGYQAGMGTSYDSPALFGRDAQPTANNQVVIGSSFYTGGIRLAENVTIDSSLLVLGSQTISADMYFNANVTAQTPTADDTIGIRYFTEGDLNGFSFDAGSGGSYTAVVQTDTAGVISVVSGTHGLNAGDWITLEDGIYDGVYVVRSVDTDTIRVTATFSSDDSGNWTEPSRLTLTQAGIIDQKFMVNWNISGSVAGTPVGDEVLWGCYVNNVPQIKTGQVRTLSTGSVFGSFGNGGKVTMSTGDDIFMCFISDDVNALTHKFGCLRIQKL
jgi:hypothetical protein